MVLNLTRKTLGRNLENWSFQFGTPSEHLGQNVDVQPLKMLGCKMLQYGIAQGHDLADAVEDLGERVGPEGLCVRGADIDSQGLKSAGRRGYCSVEKQFTHLNVFLCFLREC